MKRLILLLLPLLLTGCTALPAEERSFAVTLGVSRTADGWTAHARIPTYQTGGGYATVQGEGDTLEAALSALDAASPMQLHLGQVRLVVFSAQVARSADFPGALAVLASRSDLRMGAWLAVTETDMQTLMDAMEPTTGSRLSKSLDVLAETRFAQGMSLPSALGDVSRMGERQQPVLMNLILEEDALALTGGWPVGADGRVSQPLSAQETQLLAMMSGQMHQGVLSLEEGVVRVIAARADVQLTAVDACHVHLTLTVTQSPWTGEALCETLSSACLDVLNRLSAMSCDALGLGRQAITRVPDMAQWHALGWPARYREMAWTVSVGVE